MTSITRRTFLVRAAQAAALTPLAAHASVFTGSPAERVRIAAIGVGGMGGSDLRSVASSPFAEIVALCDVDATRLGRAAQAFPRAKGFIDYRVLFDTLERDLDAVVVSTPDHMHGPVAIRALELGKHVYCQKPLAHNIAETRRMTELASEQQVATQMGTQIHSHGAYRTAVKFLRDGVIGRVREAHLWVSKSWAGPPAGRPNHSDPVPDTLDWSAWLGVAPERPYVKGLYHPGNWRGWKDFGSGTLGDMGCHIFDPVFTALELDRMTSVISRGPQHYEETFAPDSDITYTFAGTERTTESVTLRWTDGAKMRPAVERAQLPEGAKLPGAGSFLVGERGVMVIPHWSTPQVFADGEPVALPAMILENRNHYHEWVNACRGIGETSTPFSRSGPLTEAVLAGTIAGRFRGRQLDWDATAMTFGHVGADAEVARRYRPGRAF